MSDEEEDGQEGGEAEDGEEQLGHRQVPHPGPKPGPTSTGTRAPPNLY